MKLSNLLARAHVALLSSVFVLAFAASSCGDKKASDFTTKADCEKEGHKWEDNTQTTEDTTDGTCKEKKS